MVTDTFILSVLLASPTFAIPLVIGRQVSNSTALLASNQTTTNNLVSTTNSTTPQNLASVSDVCSLTPDDPASWGPSGAGDFIQAWFDANGTTDWLEKVDQATTTIGGFDSVLDCEPLGGNTCPAPVTPCKDFTPPELRFVRIAATNAHDFFTQAHEQLQDTTIEDILSIDQIIADFAPDAAALGFNYVNAVAAGFFIASPIASLFGGPLGAILGLIGGALNFANAIDSPSAPVDKTDEWQTIVSNQLRQTFSNTADAISGLNSKLFGGSANFDLDGFVQKLQNEGVISATGLNPITEIFASGAFLANQEDNSLNDGLKAGFDRVKLSLVAGLLRAQNFYVFINTKTSESDCTATGSRFINNQCMIISQRNGDEGSHTQPVDSKILLKLDDPNAGYNINPVDLYNNAVDCNGAQLDTSISFTNTGFPKCFWSLPILKVDGPDVCDLIPADFAAAQGYPSGVDLTLASCG